MVDKRRFLYNACLILLVLSSLYICFWKLGASSFYDLNEAYLVQLSKDFPNNINLVNPAGSVTFARLYDPLPVFLTNLSFKIFGESESSARFFPAFLGFLTILLTFIFAKSIYKNNAVAFFSAFVLTTSYQFIFNRGVRSVDGYAIPVFFMLAFIFLIWKSRQDMKFFYISAIPLGLLGLSITFGLIFILGLVIILLFQSLDRRFFSLKQWGLWLLLLIITISPWVAYLLISKQYLNYLNFYFSFIVSNIARLKISGLGFLQEFISLDKFDLAASEQYNPFMLWNVLKFGLFPWSIMLMPSFVFLFIRLFKEKEYSTADKIIFSWILPTVIMLMAITIFTRSWWINILCPALAILVGKFIYDFVWDFRKNIVISFLLSAWFIAMLMVTQLLQLHQIGYHPVPWMESGLISGSLRYNVSNPIFWIFCLTVVIFLIQISVKRLSMKFANKYIFVQISAALFFVVSLTNIIYLVDNSQNKSEMDTIRNLINNEQTIISSGKKLILYNMTLLGDKPRLTPELKERWSDYYYLNKIGVPKEDINENSSLIHKLFNSNIKGNICLMKRGDFNNLINSAQKEEMKISIIWIGNEYVLLTMNSKLVI
jgi:4-amino-4-deoxy-L-arabinose transferase-like glycosyltransferase